MGGEAIFVPSKHDLSERGDWRHTCGQQPLRVKFVWRLCDYVIIHAGVGGIWLDSQGHICEKERIQAFL